MNVKSSWISLLFGLFGGLIALGLYAAFFANSSEKTTLQEQQNIAIARYAKYQAEGKTDFTIASAIATPAVVHIKTKSEGKIGRGGGQEFYFPFDFFDGPFDSRQMPSSSSGSGVILSADGYIVTNNHVIDNAETIEVTLNDNRTFTANVIGTDPSTDLALVKINEKNLPVLKFGDSDKLMVGEWVLAVGNPFNLTSTVTAGIVSAKGRSINILEDKFKIESFIQTDAAVNPGNSGGALIDVNGNLVGINTAIASRTGSYAGYSFAVPSKIVQKVVEDLMNFGSVQRGFLGVMIRDVNSELAEKEGLKVSKGVYITDVNQNSAAEEAGLKKGDVIQKIDEVEIASASELQEQIGRHRPGDRIKVLVLRGSEKVEKIVTLKNKSGTTKLAESNVNSSASSELGAQLEELSSKEAEDYKVKGGVKVARVYAGKARSAGIRDGFVITSVDRVKIKTIEDIEQQLKGKEGAVLIEGVYPNGKKAAYAVMF